MLAKLDKYLLRPDWWMFIRFGDIHVPRVSEMLNSDLLMEIQCNPR